MSNGTWLRHCNKTDSGFLHPAYTVPPVILSSVANLLLFTATHNSRKKLQRQNYFYTCVVNTLISNLLILFSFLWNLCVYYIGFLDTIEYDQTLTSAKVKNTVWVIGNAMLSSEIVVMGGNICSLIFALWDSAYFVGKRINRQASELTKDFLKNKEGESSMFAMTKRRKAILLSSTGWIVYFAICIAAAGGWNCLTTGQCCSAAYHDEYECNVMSDCSFMMPPLHNDILRLVMALWLFEVIFMTFIVAFAITKMRSVMYGKQKKTTPTSHGDSEDAVQQQTNRFAKNLPIIKIEEADKLSPDDAVEIIDCDETVEQGLTQSEPAGRKTETLTRDVQNPRERTFSLTVTVQNIRKRSSASKLLKKKVKLNYRMRCIVILAFIYILGTFPTVLLFLLSTNKMLPNNGYVMMMPPAIFLYSYTLALPFVLMKYVPHVKQSAIQFVNHVLVKMKCC